MEQEKIMPKCFFCTEIYDKVNPGGIFVRGKYICPNCEAQILKCNVTDEDYQLVINKMKELWFKAQ